MNSPNPSLFWSSLTFLRLYQPVITRYGIIRLSSSINRNGEDKAENPILRAHRIINNLTRLDIVNDDDIENKFQKIMSDRKDSSPPLKPVVKWKTSVVFFVVAVGASTLAIWRYKYIMRTEGKWVVTPYGRHKMGKEIVISDEGPRKWELFNAIDGKLESWEDFLGKYVVIYFGYTNCPDICPEELEKLSRTIEILDSSRDHIDIIPIFISVDPRRDTATMVKKYISEFSPRIRPYIGTEDMIKQVTKAFHMYYYSGPEDVSSDEYLIDHSVYSYLIGPDGRFVKLLHREEGANEWVKIIEEATGSQKIPWWKQPFV